MLWDEGKGVKGAYLELGTNSSLDAELSNFHKQ